VLATLRIRAGTRRELGDAIGSTGYLVRAPSRGCGRRVSLESGPGSLVVWGGCGRSEIAGIASDAVRSRRELIIENAVLRHQVNVLRRRSKRPTLHLVDRLKLLVGARLLPSRRAIAIVQPETVVRLHRAGFRLFWRRRARPRKTSPLPRETINLSIRTLL
jgi:hypothetical protein